MLFCHNFVTLVLEKAALVKFVQFSWHSESFCGLTLQVLESVVKNCGQTVHDEVASKQTMEELKELLKVNLVLLFSLTS